MSAGTVPTWVDRMYRPVDVRVRWRSGALASQPMIANGLDRARVIGFSPGSLQLDWKADWVKAKNIKPREALKSVRALPPGTPAKGVTVSAVILHHPDADDIGGALAPALSTAISAHYIVDIDGFVVKLIPEAYRGAHAGTGAVWDQEYIVNNFSVGIEMVNKDGPYPEAQMTGVMRLVKELMAEFKIRRDRVLAHGDVETLVLVPGTKLPVNNRANCPGRLFDWARLEQAGLALGPDDGARPEYLFFKNRPTESLQVGDGDQKKRYGGKKDADGAYGGTIRILQSDLARLGYEAVPTDKQKRALTAAGQHVFLTAGEYDEVMFRVVERFQERYMGRLRRVKGQHPNYQAGEFNLATAQMLLSVQQAKTRVPR